MTRTGSPSRTSPLVRRLIVCALLLAACLLFAGCADPLVKVKDMFTEGVVTGQWDTERLERLQDQVDDVLSRPDRYQAEGLAQARLMLAYAYALADQPEKASAALASLQSEFQPDNISVGTRALWEVVRGEVLYARALTLAHADAVAHLDEVIDLLDRTVETYRAARASGAFGEDPTLQQFFALRETNVLISGGNIVSLFDKERAVVMYTAAANAAQETVAFSDTFAAALRECARIAKEHIAALQGAPSDPGKE